MQQHRFLVFFSIVTVFGFRNVSVAQEHDHYKHEQEAVKAGEQSEETYSCPMHPDVVSDKPGKCPKCGMTLEKKSGSSEQQKMDHMLGTPTFEKYADGAVVQVWLIPHDKHKQMMSTMMQRDSSEADHSMQGMMKHGKMDARKDHMETMMSGTHHVMVNLKDESENAPLANAAVSIETISPKGESTSTDLGPMMNHFAGGFTLKEKGKHQIRVKVEVGEKTKEVNFSFDVE
ncbi:MAG: heavy metal-binding domain-containing protein [Bacteroidota bacterium]